MPTRGQVQALEQAAAATTAAEAEKRAKCEKQEKVVDASFEKYAKDVEVMANMDDTTFIDSVHFQMLLSMIQPNCDVAVTAIQILSSLMFKSELIRLTVITSGDSYVMKSLIRVIEGFDDRVHPSAARAADFLATWTMQDAAVCFSMKAEGIIPALVPLVASHDTIARKSATLLLNKLILHGGEYANGIKYVICDTAGALDALMQSAVEDGHGDAFDDVHQVEYACRVLAALATRKSIRGVPLHSNHSRASLHP